MGLAHHQQVASAGVICRLIEMRSEKAARRDLAHAARAGTKTGGFFGVVGWTLSRFRMTETAWSQPVPVALGVK